MISRFLDAAATSAVQGGGGVTILSGENYELQCTTVSSVEEAFLQIGWVALCSQLFSFALGIRPTGGARALSLWLAPEPATRGPATPLHRERTTTAG